MEEKNGHFEADFDTTTSGNKHLNCCNKPKDLFLSFFLNTVMEPQSYKYKQIWKGSKPRTLEGSKCKNNEGIHGHNFQYGLDKKK